MNVEVRGEAKAVRDLLALGERARQLRPVANGLRRIVEDSNQRRFSSRGAGSWAPLADTTQERKAAQGKDPRVLRDTQDLYHSLTSGLEVVLGLDELRFRSSVPYARYHQYGTVNMPRRKLMELRPGERRQVTRVLSDWIGEGRT